MSENEKGEEVQLTLKDRINYPYLIGNQILTFQKATLLIEYSDLEIREAIEGLEHMIPFSWKDPQFKKDIEKSEITQEVDIRPEFCGVKPDLKFCEENGIPTFEKKISLDYHARFQACINLFDRRGLLTRRNYVEKGTGNPFRDIPE